MGTHNICLYKEVDKKYPGCNLKTMELLDCALIGACAVVRLTMVDSDQMPQNVAPDHSIDCLPVSH